MGEGDRPQNGDDTGEGDARSEAPQASGGTDWLLEQLGGGRLKNFFDQTPTGVQQRLTDEKAAAPVPEDSPGFADATAAAAETPDAAADMADRAAAEEDAEAAAIAEAAAAEGAAEREAAAERAAAERDAAAARDAAAEDALAAAAQIPDPETGFEPVSGLADGGPDDDDADRDSAAADRGVADRGVSDERTDGKSDEAPEEPFWSPFGLPPLTAAEAAGAAGSATPGRSAPGSEPEAAPKRPSLRERLRHPAPPASPVAPPAPAPAVPAPPVQPAPPATGSPAADAPKAPSSRSRFAPPIEQPPAPETSAPETTAPEPAAPAEPTSTIPEPTPTSVEPTPTSTPTPPTAESRATPTSAAATGPEPVSESGSGDEEPTWDPFAAIASGETTTEQKNAAQAASIGSAFSWNLSPVAPEPSEAEAEADAESDPAATDESGASTGVGIAGVGAGADETANTADDSEVVEAELIDDDAEDPDTDEIDDAHVGDPVVEEHEPLDLHALGGLDEATRVLQADHEVVDDVPSEFAPITSRRFPTADPSEESAPGPTSRFERLDEDAVTGPGPVAAPFAAAPAAAHVNHAGLPAPTARPAHPAPPAPPAPPVRPAGSGDDDGGSGGGSLKPVPNKALVITAIVLAAVVVYGALFFLGTRLIAPDDTASVPVQTSAPAETTAPEQTTAPVETTAPVPSSGPLAVGTYAWNQLLGGECLEPFTDQWAESFTVVDCSTPHAAQLVKTDSLNVDPGAAFPGEDAIVATAQTLCQAGGLVDTDTAADLGDLQVSASYPATEAQWNAGEREYSCFVDRSGGESLTGSIIPVS